MTLYILVYLFLTSLALHIWVVFKLVQPEFKKWTAPVKKSHNLYGPVEKTCAACGNEFWVERGSEVYICSECRENGDGIGDQTGNHRRVRDE